MKSNLVFTDQSILPSPAQLTDELALSDESMKTVLLERKNIENIIRGKDKRMLLIVGPCSIHDPLAAIDYAEKLNQLRNKFEDRLVIIMRVYFEKPRTSVGWKGFINDPFIDGSCNMEEGLRRARKLLLDTTSMGLAAGMEFVDPLISHYIGDLTSWAAIGARTSESQIHREMASGLSIPIGFKNSTDGSLESAINSIISAKEPHCFISINRNGQICIKRTEGNKLGHIILRGGKQGPNYGSETLITTRSRLAQNNLNQSIIVDCSHMNAGKQFQNQISVWKDCIKKRNEGLPISGLMVESNIMEGKQNVSNKPLDYGKSITDECIGWDATEQMIKQTYADFKI